MRRITISRQWAVPIDVNPLAYVCNGSFASIWTAAGEFRSTPDSRHVDERWTLSLWADAVEKVENRTTPKISQIANFGLPRRCDALLCRYEGPWSFF
jgi:hypothetical protein